MHCLATSSCYQYILTESQNSNIFRTILKSNRDIVETDTKSVPLTHIQMTLTDTEMREESGPGATKLENIFT